MKEQERTHLGNNWLVPVVLSSGISIATLLGGLWALKQHEKYLRSRWLEEEETKEKEGEEVDGNLVGQSLYSVIEHFKSLELGPQSTILEANRRRTTSYYEKARAAHEQSLVLGIPSYPSLLRKRQEELHRLMFYYKEGTKSLRTVIVMLDQSTQRVLTEARQRILQPLNYSWDIYTKGVWIPEINMIPKEDMHVTIACPWWWHTIREGNDELNRDLSNRLRQALVIDFHHPFFLELERFVLLGGKTLVALWRTVGERTTIEENGIPTVVCDRHATTIDPMVRLRHEIFDCFTNEQHEHNFRPLTHQHRKQDSKEMADSGDGSGTSETAETPPLPPIPKRGTFKRQHTIELKTPGLGTGDGFIHTTLCRLPLDSFSTHDVELEPIHRLCREATATYSGHRMLVHRFRFVETTGAGGDSNPCVSPLFDETLEAPLKVVPKSIASATAVEIDLDAPTTLSSTASTSTTGLSNAERNALTTGRAHHLTLRRNPASVNTPTTLGIEGLFEPPP